MEGDCDGGAVNLIQNDDDGEEFGCQSARRESEVGGEEESGLARMSGTGCVGQVNRHGRREES